GQSRVPILLSLSPATLRAPQETSKIFAPRRRARHATTPAERSDTRPPHPRQAVLRYARELVDRLCPSTPRPTSCCLRASCLLSLASPISRSSCCAMKSFTIPSIFHSSLP